MEYGLPCYVAPDEECDVVETCVRKGSPAEVLYIFDFRLIDFDDFLLLFDSRLSADEEVEKSTFCQCKIQKVLFVKKSDFLLMGKSKSRLFHAERSFSN